MTDLDTRIGSEPVQKPGRSKQTYGTPREFIAAVEARWGSLIADLAASVENAKARAFVTEDEDSLTVPWADRWPTGNLWLNPPFANIGLWAAKCAAEQSYRRNGRIFLLTPASIGTEWFATHTNKIAYVLGLSPRLTFEGERDPYPKDLMLSVYGDWSGFDVWRWK